MSGSAWLKTGVAAVAALLIVAVSPVAAVANPPERTDGRSVVASCDVTTTSSEKGALQLDLQWSPDVSWWSFSFWAKDSDPSFDPPTLLGFSEETLSTDGTTYSGSASSTDDSGAPAGTATLEAVATPVGTSQTLMSRWRSHVPMLWSRSTSSYTPVELNGTLALPGFGYLDFAGCGGIDETWSSFQAKPNAFVLRDLRRSVACSFDLGRGATVGLFIDSSVVMASARYADGTATFLYGTYSPPRSRVSTTLESYDPTTGETKDPLAGTIDAKLTTVSDTTVRFTYGTTLVEESVSILSLSGRMTVDGEFQVDLSQGSCDGRESTLRQVSTDPQGPPPGGRVPSNDGPEGAITLDVGNRTVTSTRGATPNKEFHFECLEYVDEETGEDIAPIFNTVWFRVEGTGGPVTIDTAGSNFDTVLATYVRGSDGQLVDVPAGCIDDTPVGSSGIEVGQAAVTILTEQETTYLVQIGGLWSYGTLKIAVR